MQFTLVNKLVAIVGKRASGKSILCKFLVQRQQHLFQDVFVVSATESANKFYETFINKKNIFTEWDVKWIEKFWTTIKASGNCSCDKKNVLLILDDVGSEEDFKKNSSLRLMATTGRHFHLSVIILSQYLYQIAPVVRSNCDYMLAGQMNAKSRDILCDEFLLGHTTKSEFISIYNSASSNHGFMIICNTSVEDVSNVDSIYGKIKASI